MSKDRKPLFIEDKEVWEAYKKLVTPLKQSRKAKCPSPDFETHSLKSKAQSSSFPLSRKYRDIHIQATLDLHGLSLQQAYEQLQKFILFSYHKGLRCVLVVTGKGGTHPTHWWKSTGILKHNVPRWLNEEPFKSKVLEYRLAKPEHGGGGALYVFLRK